MADLSYKSFKEGKLKKNKSSKDLSYSTFLKNKQKLEAAKQEKENRTKAGLPISLKKDRAEPTAVGSLIRSVAKPLADVATQVVNVGRVAVGKEYKEFNTKYLGKVKGLGQVDVSKGPWEKENLKVLLKSAATGAEIASYLNATGVAKKTIASLTAKGVLANKATFAEWVVKNIPSLAKEGFFQGIAYTLGSQGREYADTGKPFSTKQSIRDIAISTAGNVILPTVLRKTFGPKTSKILEARLAERVAKEREILGKKIPDVGVPSAKFMTESNRTLPSPRKPGEIPIELPEPGIFESAEKIRQIPKQELVTKTTKAKKTTPTIQPTKETPTQGIPKKEGYTPNFEMKGEPYFKYSDETFTKDADKLAEEIEGLDYGTFKDWSKEIRNLDIDEITNVAMGGEKTTPNTIPANAYLSVLKNIAEETSDVKLAQKLAMSNVASKAGQELTSSRLAVTGNVTDTLRELKISQLKRKGVTPEKFIKEEKTLIKNIQKKFKEVTDDIINSLICK